MKLNPSKAFMMTALLISILASCKKNDVESSSNQSSTNQIKANPEGCKVTEMYVTSNSVRSLSRRDYFSGEQLDSSVLFQANGSITSIIHWTSYNSSFHEGKYFTAQRQFSSKSSVWYDQNMRVIRNRSESSNGSVIYDNSYEYRCK